MTEWPTNGDRRRTWPMACVLVLLAVACLLASWMLTFRVGLYPSGADVYLPPPADCAQRNQTRTAQGRAHFARSRVIICGLLRDREAHIPRLREQMAALTGLFADYAIVIVENDSKDGTRRELIRWADDDPRVHVIGCDAPVNSNRSCNLSLAATQVQFLPKTSRIEKMVRLRNIYLNYIDEHPLLKQYDYVIVEDFDLTSYTYLNGFFSTGYYLQRDERINAICSNGIFHQKLVGSVLSYKTYFDPYAHKDERNRDWSMAYNDVWSSFFRDYSCDNELISVQSCFSGRTIYRYGSVQSKRYRTYLDRNQQAICEHVGLHEHLEKMYLNSEMILYITKNNV